MEETNYRQENTGAVRSGPGGAPIGGATNTPDSVAQEMKDAVRSDKEKVVELSKRMLKMFSGHKTLVITTAIKMVEKEIGAESVYSYKFDK
jgi:hypothetical protein